MTQHFLTRIRNLRRFPARWLTLADGAILVVIAFGLQPIELLIPGEFWLALYAVAGAGLVYVALFHVPKLHLGLIAGLASLALFGRAVTIALSIHSGRSTLSHVAVLVWIGYALHVSTRLAYWYALDQEMP